MSATCDLICLANSRKHGGRCVAGLRADDGGWVRIVGPTGSGEIDLRKTEVRHSDKARPLDLIRVELAEPRPERHQPENWLDGDQRWRLIDRPIAPILKHIVRRAIATGPLIFGDVSDRIPYERFISAPAERSLDLVQPTDLRWIIRSTSVGGRQVRARFALGDVPYTLAVTDSYWEHRLSFLPPGEHPIESVGLDRNDEILLVVSLGEPFEGMCYKLVATVLVL